MVVRSIAAFIAFMYSMAVSITSIHAICSMAMANTFIHAM